MYEKALVIGDLHFPFQNQRAVSLMLTVAYRLKPDVIFINGDLMDCWQISRYTKDPAHFQDAKLGYEIQVSKGFLKELRHLFPKARIIYTFGNHEFRWHSYISNNAVELYGLKGLTLEEQLECPQLGIEVVNSGLKESYYKYGKLLIGHWDRVNKHSGMTAKNLLEDKGMSLIQNHVHRGGSSYRRLYDKDVVGYENFCLCDRSPNYMLNPNWQLGYSIVYTELKTGDFYVEQHPILELERGKKKLYRTFFNGIFYEN